MVGGEFRLLRGNGDPRIRSDVETREVVLGELFGVELDPNDREQVLGFTDTKTLFLGRLIGA